MKKFSVLIIIIFLNTDLIFSAQNFDSTPEILFIKDDNFSGQSKIFDDIIGLGYKADLIIPDSVTLQKLNSYSMVILSAGNNPNACSNSDMRLSLQSYIVKNAGKVIIEGGHTGYIAAVFPFYFGFMNKVIKISDWISDNGRELIISNEHSLSSLATIPNKLSKVLNINFTNIYDQDVCTNNKFSENFYFTSLYPGKVGILVAPSVDNPQVINYFVNYSSIADKNEAVNLLENSIFNLIGKPVSINTISTVVPQNFLLYQNYPNPFNPNTKIRFDIRTENTDAKTFVKLSVYNLSGKLISDIVSGFFDEGTFEINFNSDNLTGGVYFYKLTSGNYSHTKKMILLK